MSVLGTIGPHDPSGIFILCIKSEESTAEQSRAKLGDLRHGEGEGKGVSPAAVGWEVVWMNVRPGYSRPSQSERNLHPLYQVRGEYKQSKNRAKLP